MIIVHWKRLGIPMLCASPGISTLLNVPSELLGKRVISIRFVYKGGNMTCDDGKTFNWGCRKNETFDRYLQLHYNLINIYIYYF